MPSNGTSQNSVLAAEDSGRHRNERDRCEARALITSPGGPRTVRLLLAHCFA